MPPQEILQLGNPILFQKSTPVEDPGSRETQVIIRNLRDTLTEFRETHGFGRGIAAPQIGVLKRVLFIRMSDNRFHGPLINPEITWTSPEKMIIWDDCFSFPDLLVKVERAKMIEVEFADDSGTWQKIQAAGDFSELLQHEIDHLDGILAINRAVSPQGFSLKKEWERFHSGNDGP